MDSATGNAVPPFWQVVGIIGGAIFFGRFYVQWLASERAGRSVMPILFWYMSSIGSVLLMTFAVVSRSPVGALGQSFNLVVYGRNLIHIWRDQGTLTPLRSRIVHGLIVIIATVAVMLVVYVWWGEYADAKTKAEEISRSLWFWLAIGVVGQALFAARFIVQWVATEMQKKSVVPAAFWYLSVLASSLQATSFLQRREWVFGIGMLATLLIYLRNIWFVHHEGDKIGVQANE